MNNFEINSDDINRRLSALSTLLDSMIVPEMRKDVSKAANQRWLMRNLRVSNGNHPMIGSALEILKFLLKHGG